MSEQPLTPLLVAEVRGGVHIPPTAGAAAAAGATGTDAAAGHEHDTGCGCEATEGLFPSLSGRLGRNPLVSQASMTSLNRSMHALPVLVDTEAADSAMQALLDG